MNILRESLRVAPICAVAASLLVLSAKRALPERETGGVARCARECGISLGRRVHA